MYQSMSQESLYQGIDEPPASSVSTSAFDIVGMGNYNKIVVDGKEVVVVSASMVDALNKQQQHMKQLLNDLQMRYNRLQQQHLNLAKLVVGMQKDLENKVGYD